jgi:hypothetical protein
MTFKDELNKMVAEVRENIVMNAKNSFIDYLKVVMNDVAKEGRTDGTIDLEIECDGDEYVKLQKILVEIAGDKFEDKEAVYIWLLEEVNKTNIFEGIFMNIDNGCLSFYWNLE